MRVSVCLASFNGIEFINEQVFSILSQLGDDDELIISDNGSTDGTLEFLQHLSDPRVVLVVCSRRGVNANFENAMLLARGQYIFLSDQDDIWLPGRLDKALFQLLRGFDLVAVGMRVIDSGGRLQKQVLYPKGGLISNLIKNTYSGCALALSRKLLEQALPLPSRTPMHDWWIALIALSRGTVYVVPEVLVLYRRHGANASATNEGSGNRLTKKVSYRLIVVVDLLKRWLNQSRAGR